jgi:hypothetical protein
MTHLQSWRQVSLPDKILVISSSLLALVTFCLFLAAMYQYWAMKEQAEISRNQWKTMGDQSNTVQRQLDVMEKQANSMKEQTNAMKESLSLTNRAVKATEMQANTSQVSARAAEQSAQIGKQSFDIAERADLFVKTFQLRTPLATNEKPVIQLVLSNAGRLGFTGALIYFNYNVGSRSSLHFPLRYKKTEEPTQFTLAPTSEARTLTITVPVDPPLSQQVIKDLDHGKILLFFYGQVEGRDSLGRTHRFPFCFKYDREASGLVIICHSWVEVERKLGK